MTPAGHSVQTEVHLRRMLEAQTRVDPWHRAAAWTVAVGCTATLLVGVALGGGLDRMFGLLGLAGSIFVALGKFVVFLGVKKNAAWHPYELALIVIYMDVMVGVLVTYNLDLLYRTPALGRRLMAIRRGSMAVLALHPWMRRAAFFGVMAFVAFPVTGSGAVAGTLLGQLLGLRRLTTLAGIAGGAIVGAFGLALGATIVGAALAKQLEQTWLQVVLAVVLIAVAFFLSRWFLKQKEDALALLEAEEAAEQATRDEAARRVAEAGEPESGDDLPRAARAAE